MTQLPKEIAQLQNLTSLGLENNQLAQLPKEIGQLKKLTNLNLDNNRLTQLPKEIAQLKSLRTLSLGGNQLTQLHKELLQLNLEITWVDDHIPQNGINVNGNPFQTPPVEIVKQGKQAIIDYYQKLAQTRRNNLAKKIIVGIIISVVSTVLSTSIVYYLFGSPETATFTGLVTAVITYYFSKQQQT